MRLVDNWLCAWRFWSMRFAGLQQGTILFWVALMPSELKTQFAYHIFEIVIAVEGALIILARVVKQESLSDIQPAPLPVVKSENKA